MGLSSLILSLGECSMEDAGKLKVLDTLKNLAIPYDIYEHEAVFTIDEMDRIGLDADAEICKNLFLRNAKGDEHYLVILKGEKRADLASIARQVGSTKLSFASEERLYKFLGLLKGAVTPMGVISDVKHEVTVIVDNDIKDLPRIGVHPNVNTSSIVLSYDDLMKYIENAGNRIIYAEI